MRASDTTDDQKSHLPITVTASGFRDNDWLDRRHVALSDLESVAASDMAGLAEIVIGIHGDDTVETVRPWLPHIAAVEIYFDTAHDGRGFSLARRLTEMGFQGEIRAAGALHVDQFPHAIQCGIYALNLSRQAALRMPEQYWIDTAATIATEQSYQSRLMPISKSAS